MTHVEVDERVGGQYRIDLADAYDRIGSFDCDLLELVPNERIVFRWRFASHLDSRLTISLRRTSGEGTKLTLMHEGLAALLRTDLIWHRYKAGDQTMRDRLILAYSPLIECVAREFGSVGPPHTDLVSYGRLGLIGAIERFEPDRDGEFETYAISRIRGAMIDELRSLDWLPRSVRNRAREIERAMAELERRYERTPGDDEVACELGITVGEFEASLTQIARCSVGELWFSGGESAITHLPDRERLVVTLSCYEGLTLREIAEVLSITESNVSQLRTKAILRLRGRMDGPPEPMGPRAERGVNAAAIPGLAGVDRGWRQALDQLAAALAVADDDVSAA